MIEIFMSNLWIFTPALWVSLAAYIVWYSTTAKHYAPISPIEAKQLWKIHRQNARCDAGKWRQIKKRGQTVGFECECGYRHMQKRPIMAHSPMPSIDLRSSALDSLKTSQK